MRCEDCIHEKVCEGYSNCEEAGLYEPKRPHGTWIYKKFDEKTGISDSYFCSHCDFPLTGIYNSYCAVCGSDNREVKSGWKENATREDLVL